MLRIVLQEMRAHLKDWIVADGQIPAIGVGDVVRLGLGIDAVSPPIPTQSSGFDGITPIPRSSGEDSYAEVRGRLLVARDQDGEAVGMIVSVDSVDFAVLGCPTIDERLEGHPVSIRGNLVIEPYLWLHSVLRAAAPHGRAWVRVQRIHAIADNGGADGLNRRRSRALVDVPAVDPHGCGQADYVVDLWFDVGD
jgi:hypothetical protein